MKKNGRLLFCACKFVARLVTKVIFLFALVTLSWIKQEVKNCIPNSKLSTILLLFRFLRRNICLQNFLDAGSSVLRSGCLWEVAAVFLLSFVVAVIVRELT